MTFNMHSPTRYFHITLKYMQEFSSWSRANFSLSSIKNIRGMFITSLKVNGWSWCKDENQITTTRAQKNQRNRVQMGGRAPYLSVPALESRPQWHWSRLPSHESSEFLLPVNHVWKGEKKQPHPPTPTLHLHALQSRSCLVHPKNQNLF